MDIIFNKNIIKDKKRKREREGVVLCWRPIKSYVVPSLGIDIEKFQRQGRTKRVVSSIQFSFDTRCNNRSFANVDVRRMFIGRCSA